MLIQKHKIFVKGNKTIRHDGNFYLIRKLATQLLFSYIFICEYFVLKFVYVFTYNLLIPTFKYFVYYFLSQNCFNLSQLFQLSRIEFFTFLLFLFLRKHFFGTFQNNVLFGAFERFFQYAVFSSLVALIDWESITSPIFIFSIIQLLIY